MRFKLQRAITYATYSLSPIAYCLSLIAFSLLIGCVSGRVGPRAGAEFQLGGMRTGSNTISSSSNVGFIGGATFEGFFTENWAMRADPQVRTMSGETTDTSKQQFDIEYGYGYWSIGVVYTEVTYLEIPVQLMYCPKSENRISPLISGGIVMSIPTNEFQSIVGEATLFELDTTYTLPFSEQAHYWDLNGPSMSLMFTGGIRCRLTDALELRTETCLRYMFRDASTYVSNVFSLTTVGVTASLMIKL